jgi:hypothetical protein
MRIPLVLGGVQRLRISAREAPAVLAGFSGARLRGRIARGTFAEHEILAWRPHGLGSRLGELLNAGRAATALGARFVFHWPPQPHFDGDDVETVFDPGFIAEHHLPTLDLEEFGNLSTTIWPSDLQKLATGPHRGARMAERYEIAVPGRGLTLPTFRQAFDGLAFHPRLEQLRSDVDALPPIGLAVHLRRPDSMLPEDRFGGQISLKQLPVVLLDRIVGALRAEGAENILLLGNDQTFIAEMSESLGARTPDDLIPVASGSAQEKAFRDFFLLARAERVLGGASAFARVAQLVAGAKVIRPETVLSSTEIRRLLWSAVMDEATDRPLEATLACDHLFQRADITLSMEDELALLERTVELDPEDSTRWLGLLVRRIRSGDRAGVERTRRRIDERFAGREATAAARARGGMTSLDKASHLTAEDWDELVRRGALDERWTEGARGPAQAADPLAPSGS